MKYIYILNCDIDAQSHGCFTEPNDVLEKARHMIETQPLDMVVAADHLWVVKYIINSEESSGPITLTQFMSDTKKEKRDND
jgi:hypothetical protein